MINIPLTSTFKNTGFKQAEKSIGALEKSTGRLASALVATFSARQLGRFAKTSVMAASRLEESMSKVGVVFGNTAAQVESFGRSSAANLGISSSAALEAAGTYGNLLQAFGVGQTQAKDMSLALVQLAADMASFNNTPIDQAITALRSGLSGETEPLKRFGVALTDARLRAEALNMGLVATTKEALGPAIKAQAAYSLIMKDTALAQGDFKRTSDGVANSLRIISASAENATAIIGEGLITSLNMLVDRKEGVAALAESFEEMARFISDVTVGTGVLTQKLTSLFGILPESRRLNPSEIITTFPLFQFLARLGEAENRAARLAEIGLGDRQSPRVAEMQFALDVKRWRQQQKALEKLRKEQERIAKAEKAARLEAERRKKILEKLAKASDILDTEKASIEAALKNETLSENEILRLKLKKAILNENADKALELADQLKKSQDELYKLSQFKPADPFQEWLDTLSQIQKALSGLNVPPSVLAQSSTAQGAQSMISLGVSSGNQGLIDAGLGVLSSWINANDLLGSQAELDAERASVVAGLAGAQAEDFAARAGAAAQEAVNMFNLYVTDQLGTITDGAKEQIVKAVIDYSKEGYSTTGWYRTTGNVAL